MISEFNPSSKSDTNSPTREERHEAEQQERLPGLAQPIPSELENPSEQRQQLLLPKTD